LRLSGSKIFTAEAQRKNQEKLFFAILCALAVPKFLPQRHREKIKRNYSLRLSGSKIFTAEAQRKNQEKLFFAILCALAVKNQLTTK
jgi:hypothetical protein